MCDRKQLLGRERCALMSLVAVSAIIGGGEEDTESECEQNDASTVCDIKKSEEGGDEARAGGAAVEVEEAERFLNEAKDEYNVNKVLLARDKVDTCKQILENLKCDNDVNDESNRIEALRKHMEEDYIVKRIFREAIRIEEILVEAGQCEGWTVGSDVPEGPKGEEPFKVFYRYQENDPLITIRIEGELRMPFVPPLAVINEVDMFASWMPLLNFGLAKVGLNESRCLVQLSRVSKILFLDIAAPWPIADRELILMGQGYDVLESKGIIVITLVSPSLHEPRDDEEASVLQENIPPENPLKPRCDAIGHIYINALGDERCFMQIQLKVDVKLTMIPSALINFVTRKLVASIFKKYKSISKQVADDEREDYRERMESNPDLYEYLSSVLQQLKMSRAQL